MIAEGKSFEVSKRLLMADGDQGAFRFLYTHLRAHTGQAEDLGRRRPLPADIERCIGPGLQHLERTRSVCCAPMGPCGS
jgi:hypothetical protein